MQNRLLEALLLLIPSDLLTALVYLYLNAGKPTKQVRQLLSRNITKPDAGRRDYPAAEL